MSEAFRQVVHWDQAAIEAAANLRWSPLTLLFVVASAWWVKGPLIIATGLLADVRRRRGLPHACLGAIAGFGAASAVAAAIKEIVDRLRPALADPTFTAAVATPDSPSFPSGHAATAFAAAAAVGSLHPRLRWPLYCLATLVALSRVYLGVHYGLDVLAGAALGIAIGLGAAWAIRRLSPPPAPLPV